MLRRAPYFAATLLISSALSITTIMGVNAVATPAPANQELTPGSGGSMTDSSGNVWTLTAAGAVDENGNPVPGGGGTEAFTIYNNHIYGEDAGGTGWYIYDPATQYWSSAAAPVIDIGTPPPPPPPGSRDPSQIPFASDSVFNLPFGSGAQWTPNSQLANASVVINTEDTGWNEPIYTGTASDPLVTVANSGAATGGPGGTFQVHIPAGAQPSQPTPGDNIISIDDTVTHQWASFGNFQWTSATTATASQGSSESDYGSGLQFNNSNQDEGVGTLRESDLQAGSINHMLRIELPTDMLESVSSSPYQLAPNAWPQTAEDGFGPSQYSGTVPFGVTIGIPANAVEPEAVKANAGANMLWHELQDHGAMIRDSGGSGNGVIFQTDQNVSSSDPLIQGMEQFGSQIMSQVQILANQGPNSVNGGGTPIVPLDPDPSDAPGTGPTSNDLSLAVPAGFSDVAGTAAAAVPGISISDAWAASQPGDMSLTVSDLLGSFTINGQTFGPAGTTIGGTEAQLNAYLAAFEYTPGASAGSDTLTIDVKNQAGVEAKKTIAVTTKAASPPPIVLDANTNPMPTISASNSTITGTGAFSVFIGGTGDTATVTGGAERMLLFGGNDAVTTGDGNDTFYMASKGNTMNAGTGADTVIDSAGGNTIVMPAAGSTLDMWGSISADTLDFRPMLAGTAYVKGGSLGKFVSLTKAPNGTDAILAVSKTAGGSAIPVATLHGGAGLSLASLHTILPS